MLIILSVLAGDGAEDTWKDLKKNQRKKNQLDIMESSTVVKSV